MIRLTLTLRIAFARMLFRSQPELMVENLALRHELLVLGRNAKRPRLNALDRALWASLADTWNSRGTTCSCSNQRSIGIFIPTLARITSFRGVERILCHHLIFIHFSLPGA